jgi:hypothetical protein
MDREKKHANVVVILSITRNQTSNPQHSLLEENNANVLYIYKRSKELRSLSEVTYGCITSDACVGLLAVTFKSFC